MAGTSARSMVRAPYRSRLREQCMLTNVRFGSGRQNARQSPATAISGQSRVTPLEGWENFYVIVGSSAGGLTGLTFVVIALVGDANRIRPTGIGAFVTPTIVHFGGVLALAAFMTMPHQGVLTLSVGLGLAVKSESDVLSVTRWDFASQAGVRFPFPLSGNRALGELTVRHWSNAGVRLPNHGEDFTTFTVRINPDLPGIPRTDQITIDPRLIREYSRGASGFGPGQALP